MEKERGVDGVVDVEVFVEKIRERAWMVLVKRRETFGCFGSFGIGTGVENGKLYGKGEQNTSFYSRWCVFFFLREELNLVE